MTDIQIAQQAVPLPIGDIAASCGIDPQYVEQYGRSKAKIDYRLLREQAHRPDGKLILVTAITPTPAGEGKTTTTVGLTDGLRKIGKNAVAALREPSLGPVFGVKGGAAGGGYAQVSPMEDINLPSPAISTPSARPTTCWPLCWTTTSSRATPWASTSSRSSGSAAWT